MGMIKYSAVILSGFLLSAIPAQAAVSEGDANSAVKGALNQGIDAAITQLGQAGGYAKNPKMRIPLPEPLQKANKVLKMAGLNKQADQLADKINEAAEQAVPLAKPLLVDAVKAMTLSDAKKILTGGDRSVTDFFKSKTQDKLQQALQPKVKETVSKVGLAQQYNTFASKAAPLGVIKGEAKSIETYVTTKTLDGMFVVIGEEEKKIRQNPLAAVSQIVQSVFGGLKK